MTDGPLPLGQIREDARRLLIDSDRLGMSMENLTHICPLPFICALHTYKHVCSSVRAQRRGKKVLVLDPRISSFLGQIAEVSLLREHGVEQCAPLFLSPVQSAL